MKILLLEDNSILSDILFHHLKNSLHEPLHVSDGKSALNALIDQANKNGGDDNITALLVRIKNE